MGNKSRRSEMMDAIRSSVQHFREAGLRFMNKDIVDAVIETNSALFGEIGQMLAREKLYDLTRSVMKSSAEMTEDEAQLSLGINVVGFEMPGMISVPTDINHPLNGDCEWIPATEATIADLDANLSMLDLQIKADQNKRRNVFLLRQGMVALVGEHSSLTVSQAVIASRGVRIVQ